LTAEFYFFNQTLYKYTYTKYRSFSDKQNNDYCTHDRFGGQSKELIIDRVALLWKMTKAVHLAAWELHNKKHSYRKQIARQHSWSTL